MRCWLCALGVCSCNAVTETDVISGHVSAVARRNFGVGITTEDIYRKGGKEGGRGAMRDLLEEGEEGKRRGRTEDELRRRRRRRISIC